MAKFRTRARTLDMLGRQQIAGIPTAISELFKNAHDAYADHVEVDYYRSDGLFVLRDDGLGMTEKDFLSRWLSIGTESKVKSSSMSLAPKDPNKKERPVLGEKGIGRLAIAKIGPQVLVLSRARKGSARSRLTAAFINWSIFEYPGIDLEDIEVPVRTFEGGCLPTQRDVLDMVTEFRENIEALTSSIGSKGVSRIKGELEEFDVDPNEIDSYLGSPTLTGRGSGVHFIIKPSSELLPLDIDGTRDTDTSTPLKKALLGFTNTMVPRDEGQIIKVAFRDHKFDETSEDLLDEGEFFTPDEFEHADHQIEGEFDIYGQFKGNVRIYDEEVKGHIIPWTGNADSRTYCGPFKIKLAAIEGEKRYSALVAEEHVRISRKAGLIGGLYIYKDGVRILPYGSTDYDWLDIEYRRTKSASHYYFSHRKMFGAIEIDSENNYRLQEKAGREGFQENKAYRQFKSILKNFLQQMAADFFRQEGTYSDQFEQRKQELAKQDRDRRKREQLVSAKRKALSNDMRNFFTNVSNKMPENEVLKLNKKVVSRIDKVCKISDPDRAASMIIEIEVEARTQLKEIETKYRIHRPRIALSKTMERDWHDYTIAYAALVNEVFRPAYKHIEDVVSDAYSTRDFRINRKRRIRNSLDDLTDKTRKEIKSLSNETNQTMEALSSQVREITRDSMQNVETGLRDVMVELQHASLSKYDSEKLSIFWEGLEGKITEIAEHEADKISTIGSLFELVDFNDKTSVVDQLVAIEQRNMVLEEEVENDLQLAQLGMAIEVVNHEFSATVRSIRNSLRRLKAWADINDDLAPLYQNIRSNFEHLDGYLTLFTPLHKRLYRKEILIKGCDIHEFLKDLFKERLKRHGVALKQTKRFADSSIQGYPSSFYPVFVNLVDNAIFWLSEQNPSEERKIVLDEDNGNWTISDTGPGINPADYESIFEFGFTRKPNGRGMGLHISREALHRVGYALAPCSSTRYKGASFIISTISKDTED